MKTRFECVGDGRVRLWKQMAVTVVRHANGTVTEVRLDFLEVTARGDLWRGRGVSQIVEADAS